MQQSPTGCSNTSQQLTAKSQQLTDTTDAQISGYDRAIGVALTKRATPITLFICDERVFLSLELLDPAETVGRLYVEQYDVRLGHLDIYLRLTIGRGTL